MTGNRRSDRALAEPPGNRAGDACVAKDDRVPARQDKEGAIPDRTACSSASVAAAIAPRPARTRPDGTTARGPGPIQRP